MIPTGFEWLASRLGLATALAAALLIAGCDTAALRVPGASFSFPALGTMDRAPVTVPQALAVDEPQDVRSAHLGEDIAKTGWTACRTDTLSAGQAPALIKSRLTQALSQAAVFDRLAAPGAGASWVLHSQVRAFCAQTRGFVWRRVAGIVAIDFELAHDGAVVWKASVERVVTDADPEYTGSAVGTVEQAMRRTMADALRVVLQDAVRQIDHVVAVAPVAFVRQVAPLRS